jgi:hypothetical protein
LHLRRDGELGREGVVRAATEVEVRRSVLAASGERHQVVELEVVRFAATLSGFLGCFESFFRAPSRRFFELLDQRAQRSQMDLLDAVLLSAFDSNAAARSIKSMCSSVAVNCTLYWSGLSSFSSSRAGADNSP